MSTKKKQSPESIVREIKRKTRRKFTSEEKIRIILEGLKGVSVQRDSDRSWIFLSYRLFVLILS